MATFTFSAPGGKAYLTVAATRPDAESRYNIRCSSDFQTSVDGIRTLARALLSYAETESPEKQPELPLDTPPQPARRQRRAATEGTDGEA